MSAVKDCSTICTNCGQVVCVKCVQKCTKEHTFQKEVKGAYEESKEDIFLEAGLDAKANGGFGEDQHSGEPC